MSRKTCVAINIENVKPNYCKDYLLLRKCRDVSTIFLYQNLLWTQLHSNKPLICFDEWYAILNSYMTRAILRIEYFVFLIFATNAGAPYSITDCLSYLLDSRKKMFFVFLLLPHFLFQTFYFELPDFHIKSHICLTNVSFLDVMPPIFKYTLH